MLNQQKHIPGMTLGLLTHRYQARYVFVELLWVIASGNERKVSRFIREAGHDCAAFLTLIFGTHHP
jgi:hypothetical protein